MNPTLFAINPLYILVAGLFANLVTTAIKREHWNSNLTKTATIVLSAVSGFVAVLAQQEGLNARTLGMTIAGALAVNQTAYAMVTNKNTKLGSMLDNVFNPAANPVDPNVALAAQVVASEVKVAPVAPAVEAVAPATVPGTPPAGAVPSNSEVNGAVQPPTA